MLETTATFEYCNGASAILMSPAQKTLPVPDGFLSLSSSLHPSPSSLCTHTMMQQVRTESHVSSLSVGACQPRHSGRVRCKQWTIVTAFVWREENRNRRRVNFSSELLQDYTVKRSLDRFSAANLMLQCWMIFFFYSTRLRLGAYITHNPTWLLTVQF